MIFEFSSWIPNIVDFRLGIGRGLGIEVKKYLLVKGSYPY